MPIDLSDVILSNPVRSVCGNYFCHLEMVGESSSHVDSVKSFFFSPKAFGVRPLSPNAIRFPPNLLIVAVPAAKQTKRFSRDWCQGYFVCV